MNMNIVFNMVIGLTTMNTHRKSCTRSHISYNINYTALYLTYCMIFASSPSVGLEVWGVWGALGFGVLGFRSGFRVRFRFRV